MPIGICRYLCVPLDVSVRLDDVARSEAFRVGVIVRNYRPDLGDGHAQWTACTTTCSKQSLRCAVLRAGGHRDATAGNTVQRLMIQPDRRQRTDSPRLPVLLQLAGCRLGDRRRVQHATGVRGRTLYSVLACIEIPRARVLASTIEL